MVETVVIAVAALAVPVKFAVTVVHENVPPVFVRAKVLGLYVRAVAAVFKELTAVPEVALVNNKRNTVLTDVFAIVIVEPEPFAPDCNENPKFRLGYVPVSTTAGVTPVPEATTDAVNTGSCASDPSRRSKPSARFGYEPVRLTAGVTDGPLDVTDALNTGSAAS